MVVKALLSFLASLLFVLDLLLLLDLLELLLVLFLLAREESSDLLLDLPPSASALWMKAGWPFCLHRWQTLSFQYSGSKEICLAPPFLEPLPLDLVVTKVLPSDTAPLDLDAGPEYLSSRCNAA